MVRSCIWIIRMPFECIKFALEWLESISNGLNMYSNASNHIRLARFCIQRVRIHFESFKFALECFKSRSNGSNLHSNNSNPMWIIKFAFEWLESLLNGSIFHSMLLILLEWFEFGFKWLESFSKTLNMLLNASNLVRVVRICIRMLFEWCKFTIECFESCSNV